MRTNGLTLLRRLERDRDKYGEAASTSKQDTLRQLARTRLRTASQILRLHEALCYLRAYPDDPDLLALVESMLEGFARRRDLRDLRDELADTAVAGSVIHFSFFWYTAAWLERRWPSRLSVDWEEFEAQEKLEDLFPRLIPFAESPGLDMLGYTPREWIERFRAPSETDAAFLIRRFRKLPTDEFGRESIYESLDLPMRLSPGPGTPSRTRAKLAGAAVTFQTRPLDRARPVLRDEIRRPPPGVRVLSAAEGRKIVDLTREAMVTRHRDLYTFSHADPRDVRMVDCGDGLTFACIGTVPLRRLVLEAVYGFLTLKNGVPIGYVLASSLFGSTEVAYNVFETFRGAEAGRVFGRVMATVRHLFGSDAFSIDPYQLGHGNEEGLESGAWWFYYKLGFRPLNADVKRRVREELARMKKNPSHRSSLDTLDALSSDHMFWFAGRKRSDVMGRLEIGYIGERVSLYLGRRFGADREVGLKTCAREAADRLGARVPTSVDERRAWERWAPIVAILPGVARWSKPNRRALAAIIRAKGGRRESDFVRRFNAHPLLHGALVRLARRP